LSRAFTRNANGVTDLDGVWKVERVSGLLPPMIGVRKRISGSSGETQLGTLPGVRFAVEGLTLRYRRPLSGFVDVLEPDGTGYEGRTTFRGRQLGRFRMRPVADNAGVPI
jgi:hypothetical protein